MKNSEAILVTPKQFEIQECPVPEPKEHEILMKVEYVGMCGSDIPVSYTHLTLPTNREV